MPRILIATDSHKDVGSSRQVGEWIEVGIRRGLPGAETQVLPIADGGEGTIDALLQARGGRIRYCRVHDPLFRSRDARMGWLADQTQTAVIEIAEASGSAILAPEERNTMISSSYGTGELIRCAVEQGSRRLLIGLGGSIVSDGGMGMAQALGAQFLDKNGQELKPQKNHGFNALSLGDVAEIDYNLSAWAAKEIEVTVIADVKTPLLGPDGQARTFGPQKGANEAQIQTIDAGLTNWADVLKATFGRRFDGPRAGAAGGLGAGLAAFVDGRLVPGVEYVLDEIGFRASLEQADVVITGEGRLDPTSLHGKASLTIAAKAKRADKQVIGIFGVIAGRPADYTDNFDLIIEAAERSGAGAVPTPEQGRSLMQAAVESVVRKLE